MNARDIFGFAMLALCAGCGTVVNHTTDTMTRAGAYSGVRLDADTISYASQTNSEGSYGVWMIPFLAIDMPISAVADTLLLPYDLIKDKPQPQPSTDTQK